ncbi:hypothetical protein BH10BAC6_BH10BAC6_11710 [soil metagenome]
MKRILTLIAAVTIVCRCTATTSACYFEASYACMNRTVVAGGVRWTLYNGVLLHYTELTGQAVTSRPLMNDNYKPVLPVAMVDILSYPSIVRYTSETTPLVQGRIVRILLDDRNRLWAFSDDGGASMFDGVNWETFLRKGGKSESHWPDDRTTDVIMHNGVIRIATPSYVDEIDIQSLKRSRLLEIRGGSGYTAFVDLDNIVYYSYLTVSQIDLLANTAAIVCWRETNEDTTSAFYLAPSIPDITRASTQLITSTRYISNDVLRQIERVSFAQHPNRYAPSSLRESMFGMGLETLDNIPAIGWTYQRDGAYLDMITDANGTVYLAGFDGITVIPSPPQERTTQADEVLISSMSLYPNPASHHATIEFPNVPAKETTAMLVDASGNIVYSLSLQNPATLLDLSSLPVGMYTVVLTTERKRTARSLIVQR